MNGKRPKLLRKTQHITGDVQGVKGKLITVLLFDGRGPPENWRETLSANKSTE